ncbi:MAG: protein kinase [Planctomycetota bacterium]
MNIVGATLDSGWVVESQVSQAADATGGNFSLCFVVRRGEETAFMKAIDYVRALKSDNPAQTLNVLTQEFLFEQSILEQCGDRRLRRVVRAVDQGVVKVNTELGETVVQYLILEKADKDLRRAISAGIEFAAKLRALHQAAVGVTQLHGIGVAHQDIKPSNVLIFDSSGVKVGDLGCASDQNRPRARDGNAVAGDPWYAPPDLLYGVVEPDWEVRRMGCDAYLVGSLAYSLFTRVGITKAMVARLPQAVRSGQWRFSEVLPFWKSAFEDCIRELRGLVGPKFEDLIAVVRELCDPDPVSRRANMGEVGGPLGKYIARLDILAKRAELSVRQST